MLLAQGYGGNSGAEMSNMSIDWICEGERYIKHQGVEEDVRSR